MTTNKDNKYGECDEMFNNIFDVSTYRDRIYLRPELLKFLHSQIDLAELRLKETIIREIEEKYGKFGTISVSFGYKSNDVKALRTPEDKQRDDILTYIKGI